MTYMIQASETHPLKGGTFELFPVSMGKNGGWIRDDEHGRRWGFEHPITSEIVCVHPAGIGDVPSLGQLTRAFTVFEVSDDDLAEEEPGSVYEDENLYPEDEDEDLYPEDEDEE